MSISNVWREEVGSEEEANLKVLIWDLLNLWGKGIDNTWESEVDEENKKKKE